MPGPESPKYRGIMAHLKERMAMGQLNPGDRLPTVRALSDRWSVSHATATKVLRELCREGYARVEGNGTYVRDRNVEVTVERVRWGARHRGSSGGTPTGVFLGPPQLSDWNEITESGIVTAPDYVADVMEVPYGTQVLRVEWVLRFRQWMDGNERRPDGPARPFQLVVHWYPAAWAEISPGLLVTGMDNGNSPLIDNGYGAQLAEEATGRRAQAGIEAYHARYADEREARLLEIGSGSAVLGFVETWQDDEGVVEYRETVMPMGAVLMIEHRELVERDPE